jgi:hypothetical protein
VWLREGKATADEQFIHLTPESRAERTRTLLWMYDDQAIEYEICLFRNMDLSASFLLELLSPLKPGTELAPGLVLRGTEHQRIVLEDALGHPIPLRVSPKLEGTLGIDLLVERRPHGDIKPLQQAVRRVRAVLNRNGANELGIVQRAARPTPQHPAASQ